MQAFWAFLNNKPGILCSSRAAPWAGCQQAVCRLQRRLVLAGCQLRVLPCRRGTASPGTAGPPAAAQRLAGKGLPLLAQLSSTGLQLRSHSMAQQVLSPAAFKCCHCAPAVPTLAVMKAEKTLSQEPQCSLAPVMGLLWASDLPLLWSALTCSAVSSNGTPSTRGPAGPAGVGPEEAQR